MTRADAIPQGTYELSPSDSIPSSELAGPDVGLCVHASVCVRRGEGVGTGTRSFEDQKENETETQAGNRGHVEERRNDGATFQFFDQICSLKRTIVVRGSRYIQ